MTEQEQWSFPTLLEISILYSQLSPLSAERIFKLATLSLKEILYFRPPVTSLPSRSHLTLRSGLPDTVHSKVAESPAVTLMDGALSIILAGSEMLKNRINISTKEKNFC